MKLVLTSLVIIIPAKKSVKPRKRTQPLTIPAQVKAEPSKGGNDHNKIDETSCFDILKQNLPVTPLGANKRMKLKK